ncbi:DR2241 family protein [Haladaptatus sp. AB643]|uniref:DR2241 family protein n=1 Tax=Haladaptatus sp. AB643 TaxID=2934174 RepID=UPI0031831FB0
MGWLADGGSDEHHDATRTWGQLAITTTRTADGSRRYEIRHVEDRDEELDELDSHADPAETRDRVRFTDDGEYRPLATASTLPTGWVLSDLDAADLLRAVEFVYPATISNWYRERNGELDVSHFRETAERQTGVYADVGDIGREALDHAVEACCVDSQCSARREWDAADDDEIAVPRGDGEFPCREPCSLFIAKVREFQKMEECGEDDAEDGYRARYRSARRGGRT